MSAGPWALKRQYGTVAWRWVLDLPLCGAALGAGSAVLQLDVGALLFGGAAPLNIHQPGA